MSKVSELKLQGFIRQKEKRYYSVRLKTIAGNVTSEQMAEISEMAKKYGRGYVSLTARMNIEIPWVEKENLDRIKRKAEQAGLVVGGMGASVRPIVACKGTVCEHGLADTQGLGRLLDENFFGRKLPAKLKIGIAGCPNDCTKAELNDIGFIGQCIPVMYVFRCLRVGR
jgi:dissimilatory sulfite reductase (desulfoviridin) alpha/beta subunit